MTTSRGNKGPAYLEFHGEERYEVALQGLNERFPLMVPYYIPQLAANMFGADRHGWSLRTKSTALKAMGRPLTAAEKRQLGAPTNVKVGWDFSQVVTPLALTNPLEAARAIANAGTVAAHRFEHFLLCLQDGVDARVMIRNDTGTCEAARVYMAAIMPPREVPNFPLRRCDKWTCRCTLNRHAEWMGGRAAPASGPR